MAEAALKRPGTTTRLPRSIAFTPCSATSAGSVQKNPGSDSASEPNPAMSTNSVRTGPGQSEVALTPVPASSACRASVNESTKAFVAA
jgi:hypothetical protein